MEESDSISCHSDNIERLSGDVERRGMRKLVSVTPAGSRGLRGSGGLLAARPRAVVKRCRACAGVGTLLVRVLGQQKMEKVRGTFNHTDKFAAGAVVVYAFPLREDPYRDLALRIMHTHNYAQPH